MPSENERSLSYEKNQKFPINLYVSEFKTINILK